MEAEEVVEKSIINSVEVVTITEVVGLYTAVEDLLMVVAKAV